MGLYGSLYDYPIHVATLRASSGPPLHTGIRFNLIKNCAVANLGLSLSGT